MKKTLLGLVGVLLLLAGLLSGCATERSPIDKFNPNALDKRLFQGEFFYKQTIVDLPYSIDYSFIGETNALKIIKWEITENWLIGYNIHEKIESTNTSGVIAPAKTPVVAYPIMDHFDIKYAENAATGEHVPVRVENRDKPWWQRQYFLINTSASAVTNFELEYLNITVELENPYRQEPIGGYTNLEFMAKDETAISPTAYDPATKPLETFSFQSDFIVSPNNNWRNVYTWDDVANFISWEPARIRQRHFFWKVDRAALSQNGFHAMEFQDEMFRRFGFFTRDYRGVDPLRGYKENYHHLWANHFNTTGTNRIEYYLSPNFPHYLELAACSIGADYNHAIAKAAYEGDKARANGAAGFETDFPSIIKLQDGLYQIDQTDDPTTPDVNEARPTSLLMPDAFTPFPSDYKLDPAKFYYIDYLVEFLKPKDAWTQSDDKGYLNQFTDRRAKIAQAYRDYCFSTPDDKDKFIIKRNEFLPYDAARDGVDPEGKPNMITPEEIKAAYGNDIDNWLGRPVTYPVACKLTLEHRCETELRKDASGNYIMDGSNRRQFSVARWKVELGDPRYSMIYWVDKPTDYGILGVAQWSDNPESGQLFSGVAHIAGSVLQWSVGRELERYQMIDALKKDNYDPTAERYTQLLNDLIIDSEATHRPETPEDTDTPNTDPQQAANTNGKTTLKVMSTGATTSGSPAMGSEKWNLSATLNPTLREYGNTGKPAAGINSTSNGTVNGISNAERLRLLKEKHLPEMTRKINYSAMKGTTWENYMTPNGVMDFLYPGQTSFNEEMLYGMSPVYWGGVEAWKVLRDREIMFMEKCYFQAEWLDAGFLEIIKDLSGKGYTREDVRRTIEAVMFKGVAEHEVGHSVGLRHNFMGSADELNYAGNQFTIDSDVTRTRLDAKTGYWAFKDSYEKAVDESVTNYAQKNNLTSVSEQQRFYLSKQIASPRDWYMYSSVMDYMDEFYFHGFGLGRYDQAALLFVYGKAVEKYKPVSGTSGELEIDTATNAPKEVVQSLYEDRLCTKDDLYINECVCQDGDVDCTCIPNEKLGDVYCFNPKKVIRGVRHQATTKIDTENGKLALANVGGASTEIQLNGDVRPYLYCPDHWTYDHPMCKTWDKGYRASDIMRNMIDQYQRFYYYRFFKRGNPRFRYLPHIWVNSVFRFFPFAHYALDFNYNKFQLKEWQPMVLDQSTDPFGANVPLARKEYLLALQGKERWIDPSTNKPGQMTPGGPGDYLLAGMLGFNFLVYDVIYSADVGAHVLNSWTDDSSKKYFEKNPYIFDDADLKDNVGGKIIDVDLRYGHFHKNHWNRQDDLSITEEQFVRLGFTIEKEAASFIITNAGWWVDKYGYENMANGFSYVSDGFRNAIYQVEADIMNENHMWTFSRLCANETAANVFKLNVYQPRITELMLWGNEEVEGLAGAEKSDTTKTTCEKLQAQQNAVNPSAGLYIPLHASWVYFDKFTPALWALLNLPNTMADNTVYRYFYADVIPAAEHHLWAPVDGVNSVECISGKEDTYYRAYNYPMDSRPNPIFNLVKRCKQVQDMCVNDATLGQVPGNLKDTCKNGYPRWYLQRTMDYMEATMMMLNSFGKWTSDIGFFVLM